MTLAHSHGQDGRASPSSLRSESRPRFISQPKSGADEASLESPANTRGSPYIHPSGNSKPAEPFFLQRRPSHGGGGPPRKAGHIHTRPWTCSTAPGKRENPHQENVFHRIWISDCGVSGRPLTSPAIEFASEPLQLSKSGRLYDSRGYIKYDAKAIQRGISEPRRWTRASKKEFYDNYAEDLASRKSHDETFAVGVNKKFWTHLLNGGISAGGHLEKLDTAPKRSTGHHLKSGLYKGKFSNVQHKQMIFRDRRKTGGASYTEDRLLRDDEVHQAMIDFSKQRPAGRQPLIR